MVLREARPDDAAAATAIYNEGIAERVATFQTVPQEPNALRERIEAGRFPVVVAESDDGRVVGFAATSAYSDFPPYAGVIEFAVYVASDARRSGVGRALMEALATAGREAGFYKLIGKVFTANGPSISLLRECGFREVGVHERHGRLDGEWKDVLVVEKRLGDAAE